MFNIKIWDKNKKDTLTTEWLRNRFDLFGKYCLPNINYKVQKNLNGFVSLILTPQMNTNVN